MKVKQLVPIPDAKPMDKHPNCWVIPSRYFVDGVSWKDGIPHHWIDVEEPEAA